VFSAVGGVILCFDQPQCLARIGLLLGGESIRIQTWSEYATKCSVELSLRPVMNYSAFLISLRAFSSIGQIRVGIPKRIQVGMSSVFLSPRGLMIYVPESPATLATHQCTDSRKGRSAIISATLAFVCLGCLLLSAFANSPPLVAARGFILLGFLLPSLSHRNTSPLFSPGLSPGKGSLAHRWPLPMHPLFYIGRSF
jgi:hypothetical protein